MRPIPHPLRRSPSECSINSRPLHHSYCNRQISFCSLSAAAVRPCAEKRQCNGAGGINCDCGRKWYKV
eukprot:3934894-Rhodomonas_salina.7